MLKKEKSRPRIVNGTNLSTKGIYLLRQYSTIRKRRKKYLWLHDFFCLGSHLVFLGNKIDASIAYTAMRGLFSHSLLITVSILMVRLYIYIFFMHCVKEKPCFVLWAVCWLWAPPGGPFSPTVPHKRSSIQVVTANIINPLSGQVGIN